MVKDKIKKNQLKKRQKLESTRLTRKTHDSDYETVITS
jgi:hypothetical protein